MDWISRIMILGAINAAGDTITVNEAKDIIFAYGGDPNWVFNPPPWVDELNKHFQKYPGGETCEASTLSKS